MGLDARLSRLTPALSARERGILMLKSLKGELDEDPLWRSSMPRDQHTDFNRYIALMNTANIHLAHLITFIEKEVEKLELRLSFVIALRMSEAHLAAVNFATSIVAREPITETDHARLLEKAAAEHIPVAARGESAGGTATGLVLTECKLEEPDEELLGRRKALPGPRQGAVPG